MAVPLNTAHLINALIEGFFLSCSLATLLYNVILTVSSLLSLKISYLFIANQPSTNRQQAVNKVEGEKAYAYNSSLSPHHDGLMVNLKNFA